MPTQIIDGFRLSAATPIDTRMVTTGLASRNALQYKYEGLRVFDTVDKKAYVWLDSSWQEDGVSTIGAGAGGENGINSSIKGTQNYISKFTNAGIAESNIREQLVNGQFYVGINLQSNQQITRTLQVGGTVKAMSFEGQLNGSDILVQSVSPDRIVGAPSGNYLLKSVNGQSQWVVESTSASVLTVENDTSVKTALLTWVTGVGLQKLYTAEHTPNRALRAIPETCQLVVSSDITNNQSLPGYAFINEGSTGLYGNSTEIGLSFKGVKKLFGDSTQVTICKSDGTAQLVVGDSSVTINTALTAASMNITTLSVGGLTSTAGIDVNPLLVVKSKGLPATVKTPYVDANGEVRDGNDKIISGIPVTGGSIWAQAFSPSYLYSDGGYPAAFFVATSDPVGLKTDTGVNNRIRFFRQNPAEPEPGPGNWKYKSEIETGTIGMRFTSGTSYIIDIRNFTANGGVYIDAGAGNVQLRTSGGTYFEDIEAQTFNGTTDKRHVYVRKGGIDATGKTFIPGYSNTVFDPLQNEEITVVQESPATPGQVSDTNIQLDTTNKRIKYNSPIEYVYSKTFVSKNGKQLALGDNAAVLNNATAVFKGNDVGLAIGAYGANNFSNYGIWLQTVRDSDNLTAWNIHMQPRGGTVQMGNTTVPDNFFVLTTNGGMRLNKGMQVFTKGYGIAMEDRPTKSIVVIRDEETNKIGSRYEVLRLQSQSNTHFIMQRHGTRVIGNYSHGGVFSSVSGTAANRRLLSNTGMWVYSDDWGSNESESGMTGILHIKHTETVCPGKQYDRILYFWSTGDIATTLYFNMGYMTVGDYYQGGANWVEMFDGQAYDGQGQWIIPAFTEFKLRFRKGMVGTTTATVLIQKFGHITSSLDVGE